MTGAHFLLFFLLLSTPRNRKKSVLPDPDVEPTVSIIRAGQLFGLGKNAAYRAAKRGEIPTLRFGGKLVVPTHVLLEMLGKRKAGGGG